MSYPQTRRPYSSRTIQRLLIVGKRLVPAHSETIPMECGGKRSATPLWIYLKPKLHTLWIMIAIVVLCSVVFLADNLVRAKSPKKQTAALQESAKLSESTRLRNTSRPSEHAADVSGQSAEGNNPLINLSNSRDVRASYVGPDELRVALEQNLAQSLSLAAGDFNEDGVTDLVSGYGYKGRGIVSLLPGNGDAIYPNAPEAQQRKADRTFTDTPFVSSAQVFNAPVVADFIGAGDFDADGHADVVTAQRGGRELCLLSGDGKGNLRESKKIALPGRVTALAVGELNRPDGLADVLVGVADETGAQVLVLEGP